MTEKGRIPELFARDATPRPIIASSAKNRSNSSLVGLTAQGMVPAEIEAIYWDPDGDSDRVARLNPVGPTRWGKAANCKLLSASTVWML